jgi:hypothetical protein
VSVRPWLLVLSQIPLLGCQWVSTLGVSGEGGLLMVRFGLITYTSHENETELHRH